MDALGECLSGVITNECAEKSESRMSIGQSMKKKTKSMMGGLMTKIEKITVPSLPKFVTASSKKEI